MEAPIKKISEHKSGGKGRKTERPLSIGCQKIDLNDVMCKPEEFESRP